MEYQQLIDKFYPAGTLRRDIYLKHCRDVADEALAIAHRKDLPIADPEIETAAMLHDIGIFMTDAPGIDCHGPEPYIRHGILGADLIRQNGFDEKYARVAERHTGAGISADDIRELSLPLPSDRIMLPETLLERLICYADKFYSKSGEMKRKSYDKVIASMKKHSSATLDRFLKLQNEFE